MDWMPQAIREGIFTILFISGPLVVLAAALGLAVGVLQAATQVQEQTLGSAVKVIGLFIALIIFGFYMFQYMSKYAQDSINKAFRIVPTLTAKVLPRRNFLETPVHETEVQISLPTAAEAPSGGTGGASKIAESAREPAVESINENLKPNKLSPPASQVRPILDVDKLKAQKLQQVGAQGSSTPAQGSSTLNAQRSKPAPTQGSSTPAQGSSTPAQGSSTLNAQRSTPVPAKAPAPTPAKAPVPARVVTPVRAPAPAPVRAPAPARAPAPTPVVEPEEPRPPVTRIPRPAITGRLDKLKQEAAR